MQNRFDLTVAHRIEIDRWNHHDETRWRQGMGKKSTSIDIAYSNQLFISATLPYTQKILFKQQKKNFPPDASQWCMPKFA